MPPRKHHPLQSLPPADREFVVGRTYLVVREGGHPRRAQVLNSRTGKRGHTEAYISFVGEDKRLDKWVFSGELGEEVPEAGPSRHPANDAAEAEAGSPAPVRGDESERSTPEREHEALTRVRNFEDVRFGEYLAKTWRYYSPYPMPFDEASGPSGAAASLIGTSADAPKRGRKRKEPPSDGSGVGEGDKPRLVGSRSAVDLLATGVGKGGEGARGRLWVCDLCFKYMRTRSGWDRHALQPPGRRVYQRGGYSIWELYCQNISLFGKLFIDHKVGEKHAGAFLLTSQSVFFHVENFLFYVLCDAATSRRDQVMAFFSKEKLSYDDYNLACIVTFPMHQNRGFGKLLIEFSYLLTKHPSTRPTSGSPGTPERPLSDLGYRGYMAYWASVILRLCRTLLADAPGLSDASPSAPATPAPKAPDSVGGRSLRARRPPPTPVGDPAETVTIAGIRMTKRSEGARGQYAVCTTLKDLARACHLRADDVALALTDLGFLVHRRARTTGAVGAGAAGGLRSLSRSDSGSGSGSGGGSRPESVFGPAEDGGAGAAGGDDWVNTEIVITRDAVEEQCVRWRVKDSGLLEDKYVLL